MQPGSPAYDARLRQWCADLDRLAATVQRAVPTCEGCRAFTPDRLNPSAGVGACAKGMGGWHAAAPHHCRERIAA